MNTSILFEKAISAIEKSNLSNRVNRTLHIALTLNKKAVTYYMFLDELLNSYPGTASIVIENFRNYGYLNDTEYETLAEKRRQPLFIAGLKRNLQSRDASIEIASLYLSSAQNKNLTAFFADKKDEGVSKILTGVLQLINNTPLENIYYIRLLYCAYRALDTSLIIEQIKQYDKQFLLDTTIPTELENFYRIMLKKGDYDTLYRLSDIYVDLTPSKIGVSDFELLKRAVIGNSIGAFKRIIRAEQILSKTDPSQFDHLVTWWEALVSFKNNGNVEAIWPLLTVYKNCMFIAKQPQNIDEYLKEPVPEFILIGRHLLPENYNSFKMTALKYLAIAQDEAFMAVLKHNPTQLSEFRLYLGKWNTYEFYFPFESKRKAYVNFNFYDSIRKMLLAGQSKSEIIDTYMNTSMREHITIQFIMRRLYKTDGTKRLYNVKSIFEPYKINCRRIDFERGIIPHKIKAAPFICSEGTMKLLKNTHDKAKQYGLDPDSFLRSNLEFYIAEYDSKNGMVMSLLRTSPQIIEKRFDEYNDITKIM